MLFIAITFFCFCLVFVFSRIHFLKTTSVSRIVECTMHPFSAFFYSTYDLSVFNNTGIKDIKFTIICMSDCNTIV